MSLYEVVPNLWQGSILDSISYNADIVLTCSPESEISVLRMRTLHILFPFDDAAQLPDMEIARSVSELVAHEVALGRSALVHCTAGKNRSGLMVALVLNSLGVARGQDLVNYIRSHNPSAFTPPGDGGEYFAQYLVANT